jgi:two-component system, NtrC family, response regulator GlrR
LCSAASIGVYRISLVTSATISGSQVASLPRVTGGELRVIAGPDRGRSVPVGEAAVVVVGTSASCQLVLRDRAVSRRHLEVRIAARGFLLRDLGSRNGTFVGTSRVGELAVPPGTELRVGATHLALVASGIPTDISPSERTSFGPPPGRSLAMRRVYSLLERAADSHAAVLITGETGTGKDVAARAIHDASPRRDRPFVVFDCSGTVPSLLASELFGHARGSFTGATHDRPGLAEMASGGTLFIDEVGELPEVLQPVLLRLCESGRVQRVGESESRPVDLRIIAATSRDLRSEVRARRFREDLYYRLNVLAITMPPLRHRLEDLPELVRALMTAEGLAPGPIEGPNLDRLLQGPWPGNVRQLRNALIRGSAQGTGPGFAGLVLAPDPDEPGEGDGPGASFAQQKRRIIDEFERGFLVDLLAQHGGKIRAASLASGLERTQLKRLLAKHRLR